MNQKLMRSRHWVGVGLVLSLSACGRVGHHEGAVATGGTGMAGGGTNAVGGATAAIGGSSSGGANAVLGGSADSAEGGRADGTAGGEANDEAGAAGQAGAAPLHVAGIALGNSHTCAWLSDGTIKCWGSGTPPDLGYKSGEDIGDDELPSSVPAVTVTTTPSVKVTQLVGSYYFTCGLLSDGTAKCWGHDSDDQLGCGGSLYICEDEIPARLDPISITKEPGVSVRQLAAGRYFACALLTNGSVTCWGQNISGQLGYGDRSSVRRNEPPSASGPVSITTTPGIEATQITAAADHTCALLSTGTFKCWGYGALGYADADWVGAYDVPSAHEAVSASSTPGLKVTQLVAGAGHTCALLSDGSVKCWGGIGGKLGYGNADFVETPSSAGTLSLSTRPGITARQLAAGSDHTCALLSDGSVTCWGNNDFGQLGYGNTDAIGDDELPSAAGAVSVTNAPGVTVVQIAAGGFHTCALLSDASVKCWGDGGSGELGYGNTHNVGDDELPSSVGGVSVF
jgi:alpha-tubulin suppressor-like RCC1 family protein